MKNAMFIFIMLGSINCYAQKLLPLYEIKKTGNEDLSVTSNSQIKKNSVGASIENISISLLGQYIVDRDGTTIVSPTIVIEYKGMQYELPSSEVECAARITEIKIHKLADYKDKWIVFIKSIDDGPRGPIYLEQSIALLQGVSNRIALTFLDRIVEETHKDKIELESFVLGDQVFINLFDFQLQGRADYLLFKSNKQKTVMDNLNIRSGPGIKYSVIGKLSPGNSVWIKHFSSPLEEIDNIISPWVKIAFNKTITNSDGTEEYVSKEGYVFYGYLK